MKIGVPAEIMNSEGRVALSPAAAQALVDDGHEVLIQSGAGEGSSYVDSDYTDRGASIVDTAADAWAAEMVLKVKEPLQEEYQYLREDLLLFTYLHLAASHELTDALVNAGTTALAYETVTDKNGALPLLTPMSQVAGRAGGLASLVVPPWWTWRFAFRCAGHQGRPRRRDRWWPGGCLGGCDGTWSARRNHRDGY